MIPETVILYLFVAASLLAVVANRLRIPYTVALVLGGLILGTLHLFPTPVLTHDLLFSIFLPGLVFESAYHLSASALWRDRLAIFGLAVPGVLTSIVVTAFVFLWTSRYLPDLAAVTMPLGVALVFGATVAATDPISVVAIFRELQAPQRLTFLVESESLLNDGTAIVFFTLFLAIAMGKPVTASALAVKFLAVVGGGVLIGAIVGWLSSEVIKRVNDGMVEITFTILAAYGSFLVAMQLGYSGVISTVVAGLICGNYGAKRGMAPSVRLAVNTFWEYIGFALNSLVFLLVGLTIRLPDLLRIWPLVIAAYVAITIARGAVIYSMGALLSRSHARMPWSWNFVLIWGGIRGALSMVLVLSLPQHFPFREMLINLVFGVVLLTILIQGLSISPVARALGVLSRRHLPADFEMQRMRLTLAQMGVREIDRLRQEGVLDPQALNALATHYSQESEDAKDRLSKLDIADEDRFRTEFSRLYRRLLTMQKQRLLDARQESLIGHENFERLTADIDAGLLEVETNIDGVIERLLLPDQVAMEKKLP
ncbi:MULTISPECIES: cation:proton antiporter [Acidithiobacillus]|uniref:Sodium:proton antiporter n=2 Tax=Acidithiobacillus TaxID=119977 RepID=A0A179BJS5_ACIFR|nr:MULTISPECIES: cation:proton antiporter [Acidithiobacillus]MEB8486067.1 cation:proton antiporter [Acidithiobacillus ferriphilus]MEB8489682.1 cation:proton antiporter [Acidithiobacillus ferriphilus]MEB8492842.1 cation:proton antiporter [Acidithiobacillus ferriphilus]MEB8514637.1 cation:proton antiporter [Acidithiobacillus ferriphilus]MEB8521293.1 cation:proton antiporter [Acidithiobacillus ferriphilus]